MAKNDHHILFHEKVWNSQRSPKALRDQSWLIAPVDSQSHIALHAAVPLVPMLEWRFAQAVLRDFVPIKGDYLGSLDSLIDSINEVGSSPKFGVLERGLGELAIVALEMQKSFIQDGLVALEPKLVVGVPSGIPRS